MTSQPNQQCLFDLGDALMMRFRWRDGDGLAAKGELRWVTPWSTKLLLGDIVLADSYSGIPHAMLRVAGDLWLYCSVMSHKRSLLAVLDASKSDFKKRLPMTAQVTEAELRVNMGNAVVAVFERSGKEAWKPAEKVH